MAAQAFDITFCRCPDCRQDRADAAEDARYQALRDDDSEVVDAVGCADWPALDALLPTAFRSGDWTAFNAELSKQIEVELQKRAVQS